MILLKKVYCQWSCEIIIAHGANGIGPTFNPKRGKDHSSADHISSFLLPLSPSLLRSILSCSLSTSLYLHLLPYSHSFLQSILSCSPLTCLYSSTNWKGNSLSRHNYRQTDRPDGILKRLLAYTRKEESTITLWRCRRLWHVAVVSERHRMTCIASWHHRSQIVRLSALRTWANQVIGYQCIPSSYMELSEMPPVDRVFHRPLNYVGDNHTGSTKSQPEFRFASYRKFVALRGICGNIEADNTDWFPNV